MAQIVYDRTMSDAEGLMWRLEKDPYLSSTFANVTILDRKPNFDVLRRRMERTVMRIPRLRQRVQTVARQRERTGLGGRSGFRHRPPRASHRRSPSPARDRQLLDLATLITADPFDRTRPLWQFVIVEGLKGGRAALIEKLHHTITDGEGGVQLSLEFLDFERDARRAADAHDPGGRPRRSGAPPMPGQAIRCATCSPVHCASRSGSSSRSGTCWPTPPRSPTPRPPPPTRSAPSSTSSATPRRPGHRSGRSGRCAAISRWPSAPFTETRESARKLGGTLNTAFLTVATEAASCYHAELGEPVESLRASMAISTRTEHSGANAFSLVRMLVPTGDIPIDERFKAIHESSQAALGHSKHATLDSLAAFASTLPTSIVTRVARQQTQTVDFATSNVKGAPIPMFAAGAQLLHNYPVGPLSGVAFNLTLLSYLGNLDMGLNCDAAAVTEPALMKRCLDRAISDFLAIAG